MTEEELPPLPEVDNKRRPGEKQPEYVARVRREIDALKAAKKRRREALKTDAKRQKKLEQTTAAGRASAAKPKNQFHIIPRDPHEASETRAWLTHGQNSDTAFKSGSRRTKGKS